MLLDAEELVKAAGLAAGVGRADPRGKGATRRAEGFDEPVGRSTARSADETCDRVLSALEAAVFGEHVALPRVDLRILSDVAVGGRDRKLAAGSHEDHNLLRSNTAIRNDGSLPQISVDQV